MHLETAFSVAGILAMSGWLVLLASPLIPTWSDRIAGFAVPLLLSAGYVALLVFSERSEGGGFGSLAEVMKLFEHPAAALAGWVHFLAFDLFIGGWQCRAARRVGVRFWRVVPCLVLTFFAGPVGLLAFLAVRACSASTNRGAPAARTS